MPQIKPVVVISLGGSLVAPELGIDTAYLRQFISFVSAHLKHARFVIVVGGGRIARQYVGAAKLLGVSSSGDLDRVGIQSSRLNAELVRVSFGSVAEQKVYHHFNQNFVFTRPVLIGAGCEPGNSTDYVATYLARQYKAKLILNLTNVPYVYDRDPKKSKNAKPLEKITWKKYRKLIGSRWMPGLNTPFDPVASRLAKEQGMAVAILDGKDLKNVMNALKGNKFKGTLIKD